MGDLDEKLALQTLFGNNLKRFRKRTRLSQIGLSIKADLTPNFIHDIEHGDRGVSFATIVKLSKALRMQPFRFFLPEGVPPTSTPLMSDFPKHIEPLLRAVEDLKNHYQYEAHDGDADD